MAGWNPWIDVAIIAAFLAGLGAICYFGDKYFPIKKKQLRGATRV